MSPLYTPRLALGLLLCTGYWVLSTVPVRADDKDRKPASEKIKEVAGVAEFLRSVPKHFAILKGMDRGQRRVTLLFDGESQPRVWSLTPEAEVKLAGWWGRLDQLQIGDRVWVWLQLDRVKQPIAISMLADELSEQDMHGAGLTVESMENGLLTVKPVKGASRTLKTEKAECRRGKEKADPAGFKAGEKVYVQSTGGRARLLLDAAAFEARRAAQQASLRQRWLDEGLPGSVTFLHPFGGEMDFMLDHEAIRWGRSLEYGDKVTLQGTPPIPAVVKQVRPWRERTQLRLVVRAYDQTDLSPGQRIWLRMPAPSAEVESSSLPPDLDRPRSKAERIDWFLASIYCTCKVGGDGCTGQFYTLASCNVNACGMPNQVRKTVAAKIDEGLTDRQIFEELRQRQGGTLLQPHLLP